MPETARVRPTRKQIDFYYKTHRSQLHAPERIRIAHIVKNAGETIDTDAALQTIHNAAKQLAGGMEFSEVARLYSDCGAACELDWFARGVMVEEFDEMVFALSAGATSPVFETRFGFHIARLLERRPAGIPPLSEVYEWISAKLYAERSSLA